MARRSQFALGAALFATVAAATVYLAVVNVAVIHRVDASVLSGFVNLNGPRVRPVAFAVARLVDPKPFAVWTAAIVAVALLRRRPWSAAVVFAAIGGANVTTQLLKPALATPRISPLLADGRQIVAASWPSGHATASMALVLAAVTVAPSRWRPRLAAFGATVAVAIAFSFLTLGWHYPSDVLGGYLIAAAWVAAAIAVLDWQRRRTAGTRSQRAPSWGDLLAPAGAAIAAAVAGVAALALLRPAQVVAYVHDHPVFIVGAALLATGALLLAAGLSVALSGPPRGR